MRAGTRAARHKPYGPQPPVDKILAREAEKYIKILLNMQFYLATKILIIFSTWKIIQFELLIERSAGIGKFFQ